MATFVTIFLAQLGDKTQVANLGLFWLSLWLNNIYDCRDFNVLQENLDENSRYFKDIVGEEET